MTEKYLQAPELAGFLIRPPKLSDAKAAADLENICSQALIGSNTGLPEEYVSGWQSPGFNMADSTLLVFTPEEQLVAHVEVRDHQAPYVRVGVSIRVHPDYWDSGMPEAILAWAEARARQAVEKAPEGVQVAMRSGVNSNDAAKKALLEEQGMEVIRHFLRMEIEFEDAPEVPAVPDGIIIRPYHPETELEAVVLAYQDSFQDHFGYTREPVDKIMEDLQHWIKTDPNHDSELWLVAAEGENLAGLSICSPRMVEDPEMGHVNILGVGRVWRGRGLGLALLQHSFVEMYKKGAKRASLEVDASSLTGATRLYEKGGMSVTRQYDAYGKVLREGEDITTTSF